MRIRLSERRLLRVLTLAVVATVAFLASPGFGPAFASSGAPRAAQTPVVRFYPGQPSVKLQELMAGAAGTGTLVYYLSSRGPRRPSLVVRFSKTSASSTIARAEVFDAPPGRDYVPVTYHHHSVRLAHWLHPRIDMIALGGWWVQHGIPNYNLRANIYGYVDAMWGAVNLPHRAGQAGVLSPNELTFQIETRANSRGIPEFDYRTLVPAFPGGGYLRANYAQRECSGPLTRLPSVSPRWPYVSSVGGYEPASGTLAPPIMVDWATARIKLFAEVVTVRNQNCSYDFYSLTPMEPGQLDTPDFEAPWGLYDLSGRGHGYPNLIIRTEHYFPGDPFAAGIDPQLLGGSPPSQANEVIRYTWADHPGNRLFDYKVDVFGFHPYTQRTAIAGGELSVLAPSYRTYPRWVIGQRWPAATFVDSSGSSAETSEGIYAWSSRDIGTGYWMGWDGQPSLEQFQSIPAGLRGEYRLSRNERPSLYLSPVDDRLHLLDARAGLWNLGGGWQLRERSLGGSRYINDWQRSHTPPRSKRRHSRHSQQRLPHPSVQAEIATVDGYVLYSGTRGVIIRRARPPAYRFRTLPPTDKTSWHAFVTRLAPYRHPRGPWNFYTWQQALGGHVVYTGAGRLSALHLTSAGFDATLTVGKHPVRPPTSRFHSRCSGCHVSSRIARRSPAARTAPANSGRYVLRYDRARHRLTFARPTAPRLRATIDVPGSLATYRPASLRLTLHNSGSQDWHGTTLIRVGSRILFASAPLVPGDGIWRTDLAWSPWAAGATALSVSAGSHALLRSTLRIRNTPRPSAAVLLSESVPLRTTEGLPIILAILMMAGSYLLLRRSYGRD